LNALEKINIKEKSKLTDIFLLSVPSGTTLVLIVVLDVFALLFITALRKADQAQSLPQSRIKDNG
jgi:hypothetical protein